MTKKTWDNKTHMLVLVDQHTKFTGVIAFTDKKSAMQCVRTFVALCDNAFDVCIKYLHSDGECKRRKDLDDMCAQAGIIQEFSLTETPQLNGEAERLMRTSVEAARALCYGGHLSADLWEHAMHYYAYVHNLPLGGSLMERLLGRPVPNDRYHLCRSSTLENM